MKKVAVLGAGLVGSLLARDLASDGRYEVVAVDRSDEALGRLLGHPRLYVEKADLSSEGEVERVASQVDAVVGAVPGFLGTQVVRTVIGCRKPMADISFSPEDPYELDAAARKAKVPVIVDCGVSPGISGLVAGRAHALFDETDAIRIFVGGLPARRVWPYEYRTVFSPTDVIEEYVRPARLVDGGVLVTVPALSGTELIDFPVVGTLEAFYTDGLRTIIRTIPAKHLAEKTLRYPGHADRMRMLRETGFFSREDIEVDGVLVSPRSLTEKLLFEAWRRPPGDVEFLILRVVCEGTTGGRVMRLTFDLYDETDPVTGFTAMARTTGFPCAIAARLLLEGEYTTPGIHPLEDLGADPALHEKFRQGLDARGIRLLEEAQELGPA